MTLTPSPFSLRLANLRSLGDTGLIPIRPITILVGKNNSGKSSFTRFFPLLKQSLEGRTNAPLLWYGPFVDFGSFEEVISAFARNKTITVEFTLPIGTLSRSLYLTGYYPGRDNPLEGIETIRYGIDLTSRAERTAVSGVRLTIATETLEFRFAGEGIIDSVSINDLDVTQYFDADIVGVQNEHLVPTFLIKEPRLRRRQFLTRQFPIPTLPTVDEALFNLLKSNVHGNVTSATINRVRESLSYHPTEAFIASMEAKPFTSHSWRAFVESVKSGYNKSDITHLRYLYLIRDIPSICIAIESMFRAIATGTSYVGPARAPTERYYRMQELAVAQIDPAGANFAMFLNSLRPAEQSDFEQWTERYLGYSIVPRRSLGHLRLMLREKEALPEYNLADMGYGFSQVFPVMAQIWLGLRSTLSNTLSVVAIEQPELHLHPALQTKIADALVGAIVGRNPRSGQLLLVVETHSEALINRLGELIANKQYPAGDVAVYLFEKEEGDNATVVRAASFDDEGVLENWPFGFFSGRQPLPG